MERLTKKISDNEYDFTDEEYVDVDIEEILKKLGKLEDSEERVGCPLEVVFKALKQGFVYCCDDYDEDILEKLEVSHFTNYKGLGWCLQNISGVNVNFKHNSYEATYVFKSEVFLLKDYKKTWFLREDKSE